MLLLSSDDGWKIIVNTNYQEVMKTLMSLVTASLLLPFFLIRNFLGVPEGQPIAKYLRSSAYLSWFSLLLSLVCGMVFYYMSAKFAKVVLGGTEPCPETFFENARDWFGTGAVIFFLFGLVFLGWFFTRIHSDRQ
jgi:hypothetical protein